MNNPVNVLRPVPFTRVLILLLVILCVVQIGAVVRSLTLTPEVAARVRLNPALELISGFLWALSFALAAWALMRRWGRARRWAVLLVVGFAGYSIARLIIFAGADYDRTRSPFLGLLLMLIFSLVIVIPVISHVIFGDKRL